MHWKQARGRGTCQSYSLRLAARLTWSRRPGVTLFSIALPRHGPGARPPRGPPRRARANHMILDWLGVVVQALLFWCCSSTAMPVAGQRLPAAQLAAEAGPGKGQIWRSFPATSCMRMQWCLLWSKYSLSHKMIFSLEVYQNRGLVLTTTMTNRRFLIMVMLMIGINKSSTQNLMRVLIFANQVKVRLQLLVVEFCSRRY